MRSRLPIARRCHRRPAAGASAECPPPSSSSASSFLESAGGGVADLSETELRYAPEANLYRLQVECVEGVSESGTRSVVASGARHFFLFLFLSRGCATLSATVTALCGAGGRRIVVVVYISGRWSASCQSISRLAISEINDIAARSLPIAAYTTALNALSASAFMRSSICCALLARARPSLSSSSGGGGVKYEDAARRTAESGIVHCTLG